MTRRRGSTDGGTKSDKVVHLADNKSNSGITAKTTSRESGWAVRGVSAETQNAARLAARRAGLTLGEWVNQALRTAAMTELKSPAVPALTHEDALRAILAQLEKRDADAAATAATIAQLAGQVAELRQRQEREKRGFLARLFGR